MVSRICLRSCESTKSGERWPNEQCLCEGQFDIGGGGGGGGSVGDCASPAAIRLTSSPPDLNLAVAARERQRSSDCSRANPNAPASIRH